MSMAVDSADLGGDGSLEGIANIVNIISNGMAVVYSSLYVIAPDGKSVIGSRDIQDYGTISGFYRVPGRKSCVLLASKWQVGSDPKRGEGLYAVGHWYVVKHDALVPYTDLHSMRRRLLYSFSDELDHTKATPMLWFKSRSTKIFGSAARSPQ
ncbi:MAG: hypothetical protein ACREBW_03595 [Candidatus Micrarchaeaceae archaeon]